MRLRHPKVLAVLLLLLAAAVAYQLRPMEKIRVGEFTLEVARTEHQIHKGLMGRRELGANEGMLFVMPEDEQPATFWMKDCYIPLDLVFIGPNGNVQAVFSANPPKAGEPLKTYQVVGHMDVALTGNKAAPYNPVTPTKFVVEVRQGEGQRLISQPDAMNIFFSRFP